MFYKKNILKHVLVFLYFFMAFVILLIFTYNQGQFKHNHFNISKNAMKIQLDHINLDMIRSLNVNDFVVYSKNTVSREHYSIWKIWMKGKIESPNIVKGHFFKESDFSNHRCLAVIGKDVKNSGCIITKDNDTYFVDDDNQLYEVIGIMGYEFDNVLNGTIFLNADKQLSGSEIYVDANNKKIIDKFITEMKMKITFQARKITGNDINKVANTNIYFDILFVLLILVVQVIMIISIIHFFVMIKEELYIKKLIGVCFVNILWEMTKRFTGIVLITCVFGLVLINPISYIVLKKYAISLGMVNQIILLGIATMEIYVVFIGGLFILYCNKKFKVWR